RPRPSSGALSRPRRRVAGRRMRRRRLPSRSRRAAFHRLSRASKGRDAATPRRTPRRCRVESMHDSGSCRRAVAIRRERPERKVGAVPVIAEVEHADRKSTRLNSSHVKISYAVFCLKKKKKKKNKEWKKKREECTK